jgi:hypothetical protein
MKLSRKAATAVMTLLGLAILGYVAYSVIYVATAPGHRLEASHTILDVAVAISCLTGAVRSARGGRLGARPSSNHDGLTARHPARQFPNH